MRVAAHDRPARTDEEVQVGAGVGLQDVVDVEAFPAARRVGERRDRRRVGAAGGQLVGGDVEIEAAARSLADVREAVAAASGATCSTTVPYAVPLIRPSQTRTMSRTPRASSLGGNGRFATSGIPG